MRGTHSPAISRFSFRDRPRLLLALTALLLVVSGCGSGDEAAVDTRPVADAVLKSTTTMANVAQAVTSLEEVRGAVVRIVAEGSFVDPEYGAQFNAAGSGSGFFVSSDGFAVTNNHVVTGAALLRVFVDGEDEPRNARTVAVSECSDLAVIKVDGDDFPFLTWRESELTVGTPLYAAGFPLGDDEYTLLDGIVSKLKADGESDWASVDSVIEHSADTLPGSSGGPIVDADGLVIAVNYAGDSSGQSYAIGHDEAFKVLPSLLDGIDVTSIGINGQAFTEGIWVASVASGSPAGQLGIKAGDLVTLFEGIVPSLDGTMADYCDVLRSHEMSDPMEIEVYRPDSDSVYEGTLNSGELVATYVPPPAVETTTTTTAAPVVTAGYDEYVSLSDESFAIEVDAPADWVDVNRAWWDQDDFAIGAAISASTDLEGFINRWDTPGFFMGASALLADVFTAEEFLDSKGYSDCTYDGRTPYSDALYTGVFDTWVDCGEPGSQFVELAALSDDGGHLVQIQAVLVSDADWEALNQILASFIASTEVLLDGDYELPAG